MWQACARKEWDENRVLLLDFAAVCLMGITLFAGDRALGFLLVGGALAAALAARLGGSETLSGTWEFILTRPIDREQWVSMRFALGLIPVLLLLAAVVLADAFDLHERIAHLLAEPMRDATATPIDWSAYALCAGMVILCYAITFLLALRERRPEYVLWHAGSGALAAFVLTSMASAALGMTHHFDQPILDFLHLDEPGAARARLGVSACLAALAFGALLGCRRTYATRQVDAGAVQVATPRNDQHGHLAVIATLLLVAALVMLAVLLLAVQTSRFNR